MSDTTVPIPGSDVYTWYFTLTETEYNLLNAAYPDLVKEFHHYTDGLWYAKQSDLTDADNEYDAIKNLGFEFGEAWFTRSTEPNFFP